MIRFGIIGCGTHGERYLRHLALGDVRGARPVAIWRRDQAKASEIAMRYGVQAYESWREMVTDPVVDALVLATPPGARMEIVEAVARAGKPLLVEKPLVGTLEDALELRSRLPDGARIMMAHTLRFNVALQEARSRLVDLGELHRVRIAQRLPPSTLAWQRDEAMAGGGSITLTGVHGFDLLRWLVDANPAKVSARTLTLMDHPFENLFDARFEYLDRPMFASVEVAKFSDSRSALLELVGTKGQIWVDYLAGWVGWLSGDGEPAMLAEPGETPTIPPTVAAFCAWVEEGGDCPVPLDAGIEALRLADACYRSDAKGGVPVPVTEES